MLQRSKKSGPEAWPHSLSAIRVRSINWDGLALAVFFEYVITLWWTPCCQCALNWRIFGRLAIAENLKARVPLQIICSPVIRPSEWNRAWQCPPVRTNRNGGFTDTKAG